MAESINTLDKPLDKDIDFLIELIKKYENDSNEPLMRRIKTQQLIKKPTIETPDVIAFNKWCKLQITNTPI